MYFSYHIENTKVKFNELWLSSFKTGINKKYLSKRINHIFLYVWNLSRQAKHYQNNVFLTESTKARQLKFESLLHT